MDKLGEYSVHIYREGGEYMSLSPEWPGMRKHAVGSADGHVALTTLLRVPHLD